MQTPSIEIFPSNRNFGLMFSAIFLLFSAFAAYQNAEPLKVYGWLIAALILALLAVFTPNLLNPFYRAWMKVGELMGKIVSPIVLGVIFFLLITPIALVSRLFGRDELRLNKTNSDSYWINRVPPGPTGESFKNQF